MLKSFKSNQKLVIRIENKVCSLWHNNKETHIFVGIFKMLRKIVFSVFFDKATVDKFLQRAYINSHCVFNSSLFNNSSPILTSCWCAIKIGYNVYPSAIISVAISFME